MFCFVWVGFLFALVLVFWIFVLGFMIQGLTMWLWMSWNLLCSMRLALNSNFLPDTFSQVLGLMACANIHSCNLFFKVIINKVIDQEHHQCQPHLQHYSAVSTQMHFFNCLFNTHLKIKTATKHMDTLETGLILHSKHDSCINTDTNV